MKLTTPEISWHGKEPVLSVDFCKIGNTMRLASAGADNDVKMWMVSFNAEGKAKTEFLSNLSRHNKAVNVVRFAPNEEILASASDDGVIILWKLNTSQEQCTQSFMDKDDEVENRESWSAHKVLRGHLEDVYDLAWSPDGLQLISGSVDNSAIIWDVVKGVKLQILKDHQHYVQGVCWDPLGQHIVTNSSDRSCRIYCSQTYRCCYNINKLSGSAKLKLPEGGELKQTKMFHDETMLSFFRRPTFTPDGSLLIVPAGRIDMPGKAMNATFVFTRGSPNKPVLYLPSPKKPTVAARCCPVLFELKKKDEEMEKENKKEQETSSLFKLPYRMVFAVATLNSVLLYDSQHKVPFGYISNIHYSGISDLTWSNDGRVLIISSTDGYCTMVHFGEDELGTLYEKTLKDVLKNPNGFQNLSHSSLPSTPAQTPKTPGTVQKGVILTPVQKMDIDETPDDNIQKKKDTPQIEKFTVPMSQMQTITPTRPPENKLTPRRVQLIPLNQPANAVAGPKPVSGQTGTSRPVQLVTTNQTDASLASIQSLVHNVQSAFVTPTVQSSYGPGQMVVTGQTAQSQPQRVQLVTAVPSKVLQGAHSAQAANTASNVHTIQVIPGQAVPAQQRRVQLVTLPQGQTGQALPTQVQSVAATQGQTGQVQPRRVQLVTVPLVPSTNNQVQPTQTPGQTVKAQPAVQAVTTLPGHTAKSQPRRVQLVSLPPGQTTIVSRQTLGNTQNTNVPQSTQVASSKPGQGTSNQTAPINPVALETAPTNPVEPKRVQLQSVKNSEATTAENSNTVVRNNALRKQIPLEPIVIVID